MILEYHRPKDLDQALKLLSRDQPRTFPIGGGTVLSTHQDGDIDVVDLQLLGFEQITTTGNQIQAGSRVTLEQLIQHPDVPNAVKDAIGLEATLNTRNMATIAGAIVAGDGTSPLLTVLMALDAHLVWLPGEISQALGDYLSLRKNGAPGKLITRVEFATQTKTQFGAVGRTPMDRPVFCIAINRWPSGRTRVCLGGKTKAPILVMDGTEVNGIDEALNNACSQIINPWISQEYLKDTTQRLAHRLISA